MRIIEEKMRMIEEKLRIIEEKMRIIEEKLIGGKGKIELFFLPHQFIFN